MARYKYSQRDKSLDNSNIQLFRVYEVKGEVISSEFTLEVISANSRRTIDALKYLVDCLEKEEQERLKQINNMLAD